MFAVFELHLLRSAWKCNKKKQAGWEKNEVGGCFLAGFCACTWAFGFCFSAPQLHWEE
jgi:hypothetical protein